jgi:hypothetical protein
LILKGNWCDPDFARFGVTSREMTPDSTDRRVAAHPIAVERARQIRGSSLSVAPGIPFSLPEKSGKQIERCLISTFQVAESMGFKGDFRQWEHLLRVGE